jgi:hypothetical protein
MAASSFLMAAACINFIILFIFVTIVRGQDDEQNTLRFQDVGQYRIFWDYENPYLEVYNIYPVSDSAHNDTVMKEGKLLFRTLENWPFLTVGYAASFRQGGPIVDGNYKPDEWTLFETPYQSILHTEYLNDEKTHGEMLVLKGEVWGLVTLASYEMIFTIPKNDSNHLNNQLEFKIKVLNRFILSYI